MCKWGSCEHGGGCVNGVGVQMGCEHGGCANVGGACVNGL